MSDGSVLNLATVAGGDIALDEDISASTTIASGSNGVSLPTGTIFAATTTGFLSTGVIFVTTASGVQTVKYTSVTGGGTPSFNGCTGGTGAMSTGGAITNNLKLPVSKLHTGAHGVDGGAVTSANPLPVGLAPSLTSILNNATVTASGSMVVSGVGGREVTLGLTITGAVTGTTPSLSITMQEIDPLNQSTVMTSPGNSISMGPYTSTSHTNYLSMLSSTGTVLVTWTVTGTTPSFAGVDLWTVVRPIQLLTYGLNQASTQLPLSVVAMDANSNTQVVGTAANGAAVSGNPLLNAGYDGTDVRTFFTDTSGRQVVVGAAGTGVSPGGQSPVLMGGNDAGPLVRVLLTDTSGRLIPTGAAAAGATVAGNPLLMGGSDGTLARALLLDTSGHQLVAGAAAAGAAPVGNPLLMGGTDGSFARSILTDTSGREVVVGAAGNGVTVAGNPVLVGGSDGSAARSLATDTGGRLLVAGAVPTGSSLTGNPVRIGASDGSLAQDLRVTPIAGIEGLLVHSAERQRATYSAVSSNVTVPTTAGSDFWMIVGSSSKVVRILHIDISITTTSTTGATANLILVKRSSNNSGGTLGNSTNTPHDSNNAAATVTVSTYTAVPTSMGSLVGGVRAAKIGIPYYAAASATSGISEVVSWDFGQGGQELILRGTTQLLAIQTTGTALPTGASVAISVQWSEDTV